MSCKLELTGKKFHLLKVIERAYNKNKHWYWKCECECGESTIVESSKLTSGHTKSCGHLRLEKVTSHKISSHPLYHVWYNMIERCYNKNHKSYKYYGGRGINVCNKWRNNVTLFYKWSLLNGYKSGLQIDRENNNGNYSPNNCRWVTKCVNQSNRRNNYFLTYNGITLTKTQWSKKLNFSNTIIHMRLANGWSIEKTLSTPKIKNSGRHKKNQ